MVASTQDLVHALGEAGAPAGRAVVAAEQTGGRGSRGRSWASPRGGLWLSILCRPGDEAAALVLSLRAGLAVADVLEAEAPGLALRLKWPNDLMLGERKVGGILCEARWQGNSIGWVAVGIGLNVRNALPPEVGDAAVALEAIHPGLSPERLAEPVRAAIAAAGTGAGPLTPGELLRYVARDWLRGRALREPLEGIAAGTSPEGALLVRVPSGTLVPVRSGSVVLR